MNTTLLYLSKYNKQIIKERGCSMNATPKRPSNKNQRQGALEDPNQKMDRAQGIALSYFQKLNHV
jgi:hypothetical protein